MKKYYYHKLHKWSLKTLLYLYRSEEKYNNCQSAAIFYNASNFTLVCQNCIGEVEARIPLDSYYTMEYHFKDFAGRFPENYHYPTLPLNYKRQLISQLYTGIPLNHLWPCVQIQELKRFDKIYPVNVHDPRVYTVKYQTINLTVVMNSPVKIFGIILGGWVDFEPVKKVLRWTTDLSVDLSYLIPLTSNEEIIIILDPPFSKHFSVNIDYPIGAKLFSGKLNPNQTKIVNGIEFTLSDKKNLGNDNNGPILGFYTQ